VIEKNNIQESYPKCREAALRFLDYRIRSESELRNHLIAGKKYDREVVEVVIEGLRRIGLIDDKVFADNWVRSRTMYRQKSTLIIRRELLQKGVAIDIINGAVGDVNDEDSAFKAGLKKAKLLKRADFRSFSNKISSFLARRGYNSDVVRSVIERLWQSNDENPSDD
jgi:regulatory protein